MWHLLNKLAVRRYTMSRESDGERGAVAIEYAVLAGVVAVVLIGGATVFFTGLSDWFGDLIDNLPGFDGVGGGGGEG